MLIQPGTYGGSGTLPLILAMSTTQLRPRRAGSWLRCSCPIATARRWCWRLRLAVSSSPARWRGRCGSRWMCWWCARSRSAPYPTLVAGALSGAAVTSAVRRILAHHQRISASRSALAGALAQAPAPAPGCRDRTRQQYGAAGPPGHVVLIAAGVRRAALLVPGCQRR